MARHDRYTGGNIHVAHRFEYADASARTGASGLLPADIYTLALQLDDFSLWLLTDDSPVTWVAVGGSGGGGGALDYVRVIDSKASGTDGGTFTTGAWQTRTLTTETDDTAGIATLASNQITLAAGTYRVLASAPAYNCGRHTLRIRDVTNGVDLAIGGVAFAFGVQQTHAPLAGRFTLAGSAAIEVQHRCETTSATIGFGISAGFGVAEVYAVIELWRE